MPARCVICKTIGDKALKRAMHRFPTEISLKEAWINALSLNEDLFTLKGIYLCSDHFRETDFIIHPSGARTLKPGSVPFRIPANIEKRLKQIDALQSNNINGPHLKNQLISEHFNENDYCIKPSGIRYTKPHSVPVQNILYAQPSVAVVTINTSHQQRNRHQIDMDNIKSIRKQCILAKSTIKEQNKKIQMLGQSIRRIRRRIQKTHSRLVYFKRKNMLTPKAMEIITI